MTSAPHFAILCSNTLMGIGLKSLLEKMVPHVKIALFFTEEELMAEERNTYFFHYFAESEIALRSTSALGSKIHRTILLTNGEPSTEEAAHHCLNIRQNEAGVIRDLLQISQKGHPRSHGEQKIASHKTENQLTLRESEVLKLIVRGMTNKRIAEQLGIGLTTVITHRRNLTRKLGIRSVSALTFYAIKNGLVTKIDK